MEGEDRTPDLVRVYLVVGWVALVLLAVVMGLVYRRVAVGRLVYEVEGQAVVVAQRFIAASWPEYEAFVREAPELPAGELPEDPTAMEASRALQALSEGSDVAKIRLYGASGLIVASTQVEEVGGYATDPVVLEMSTGRWYGGGRLNADSQLVHGEAADPALEDADLVITHVVIQTNEPRAIGTVGGVLSVYHNVTQALRGIAQVQALGMGGVIAAATLALGVTWLRRHRSTT